MAVGLRTIRAWTPRVAARLSGLLLLTLLAACGGGGGGGPSSQTNPLPVTPTGLTGSAASGQALIKWDAVPGATGYEVERSTTSAGPYAALTTTSATSYADNGLTNGTSYYYVVVALNAAGQGTPTAPISVTPRAMLAITTVNLPSATVGVAYSATLAASGGTGTYHWSVAGLPTGLVLTGNAIGGTPSALPGNAGLTVTVTDSATTAQTASAPLTLTVNDSPVLIGTTTAPAATVGVPYAVTLAASGGYGALHWAIGGGTLPAGLTLTGNTISGTPSAAASGASVTVTATDSATPAMSASQALTLTVQPPPLQIGTVTLPAATVGAAYTATLSALGGTPPYTWTRAGGALPAGLALSGSTLSGTPAVAGPATFSLTVTDSSATAQSASQALTLAVNAAPFSITTTNLGGATVGSAYSNTLSATGGMAPVRWSVASGTLPAGLALNATSGAIGGTPTTAGAATFTIAATDSASPAHTASRALTLSVVTTPLTVTTTALPGATIGSAYSASLAASGGTGAYHWSVTGLPSGMTLSGNTISGTPGVPNGNVNLTVTVTDSATTPQTTSQALALTVNDTPVRIGTPSLPAATVGVPYSVSLAASGGYGALHWAISAGTLPAGLTLTGNTISGTPSTATSGAGITVTASDSAAPAMSASQALTLTVQPAPLRISTATLPGGTIGAAYSASLAASGGTGAYHWAVSGALPAGLTLSGNTISGTPSVPQSGVSLTVTVTDSATTAQTTSEPLTLSIGDTPVLISTKSLPAATVGVPYSVALAASGGYGTLHWAVSAGTLPAGLTLAGNTISGTPSTATGGASITVTASDSAAPAMSASQALTLTVQPPTLQISTTALPGGTVGVAYSAPLAASGGTGAYHWAVSGALPAGLALTGNTISGTPAATASSAQVTLTVTDSASSPQTASRLVTLSISGGTTVVPTGVVSGAGLPVSGAAIQLWAVGTGGDASSATPLLSGTLTTSDGSGVANGNANGGNRSNTLPAGAFTLTGAYVCPTASTPVYLTATGGNPGLASGTNPQLALMTFVGNCGALGAAPAVVLNEVTTVATVAALGGYMTVAGSFGALSYNTITTNANVRKAFPDDSAPFAQNALKVTQYANLQTGRAPGPALPAGHGASTAVLVSLANTLAACVHSTGGAAGDGSACGKLFTYASFPGKSIPTDTVAAAVAVLQNPSQLYLQNPGYSTDTTCNLWSLGSASPVFAGGATSCSTTTFTWQMPIAPLVANPVIVPKSVPAQPGVPLFITDSTAGASIVYTTDGSTPTALHGTKCTPSLITATTPVPCLTPAGTGLVQAIAIDAAGNGSAVVSQAIVPLATPAPVTGLVASAAAAGVSLVWNASAGATGYTVYRYALSPGVYVSTASPSFATGLTRVNTTTATAYLDNTATAGTDYLYVVTASNASGESPYSAHSCSSPAGSAPNLPTVRPRIFMAAHGTNLTQNVADTVTAYDGPGALLNQPQSAWAFVATCLDGVWGNWAGINDPDQQALFNAINTRNLHTEYDVIATLGNATPGLYAVTDGQLVGPQSSALGPIVLNREGLSLYTGGAGLWKTYSSVLNLANVQAQYRVNGGATDWARYSNLYWGTDITQWTNPAVVPAAGVHGGALSIPESVTAFSGLKGLFIEGGIDTGGLQQQSINAIVATHLRGGPFIAFYSLPGNLSRNAPQSSYWLKQLQQDYSVAAHVSCNGLYDPATGNYYPASGLYNPLNNTYTAYPASITGNPALTSYTTCLNGAPTGKGLWQSGDVIVIINYNGYYPPVPEYAAAPQPGVPGTYSDSATGVINWLLHQ